jgi:ribosomal protein S18 acetylase RimI-like enzyme
MALRLRGAKAADCAAITELHVASWRDAYRNILAPEFLAGPVEGELAAHWQAALSGRRRPGAVIIAVAGRQAAGFVAAWRDGSNCHIDNLHVRPGLRGAGIGRALLGFAAQRLQDQGAITADLWAFAGNSGAFRFYLRLGGEVGPPVLRETHGQSIAERRVSWPAIGTLVTACAAR